MTTGAAAAVPGFVIGVRMPSPLSVNVLVSGSFTPVLPRAVCTIATPWNASGTPFLSYQRTPMRQASPQSSSRLVRSCSDGAMRPVTVRIQQVATTSHAWNVFSWDSHPSLS